MDNEYYLAIRIVANDEYCVFLYGIVLPKKKMVSLHHYHNGNIFRFNSCLYRNVYRNSFYLMEKNKK